MNHFGETLVSGVSWTLMILAAIITEGDQKTIMFCLGVIASLVTISSKFYDIYLKRKSNKNK